MKAIAAPSLLCLMLTAHTAVFAKDIVRHKIPDSDFPIASAVEVPAGKTIVYLSGAGPKITDKSLKPDAIASYGDTKAQTISTMEAIKANLESMKMSMKDVVKMQVFIVGDPAKDGKIDFAGFMDGYKQYFGADKGNLPARSTVKVAGLVNPGWLIEIEVTAIAPK